MITSSNVKSAALTAFLVSVAQRHARVSSTDTTIIQFFSFPYSISLIFDSRAILLLLIPPLGTCPLEGRARRKHCGLGRAWDFHLGVEKKWFTVFDARRFFGQPRRDLWMGMPTTKWEMFFFGRAAFVVLLYLRTRRGKRLLFFAVLLPKDRSERGQSSFEGALNRPVLRGFLPLSIHLSQTSQDQRTTWLTPYCIYRPNPTHIDAEFKVTPTQGVQKEVVYQGNIHRMQSVQNSELASLC